MVASQKNLTMRTRMTSSETHMRSSDWANVLVFTGILIVISIALMRVYVAVHFLIKFW